MADYVDRSWHRATIADVATTLALQADMRASMGEPRALSQTLQGEDGFTYRVTVIVEVSP